MIFPFSTKKEKLKVISAHFCVHLCCISTTVKIRHTQIRLMTHTFFHPDSSAATGKFYPNSKDFIWHVELS